MKVFKILVLTLLVSVNAMATTQGNEGTGGGDPDAMEFAMLGQKIANFIWSESSPLSSKFTWDAFTIREKARKLYQGLNDNQSLSSIQFVDERPEDGFGVKKVAVYTVSPLCIKVHRETWLKYNSKEKISLVAMELLGLSGFISDRYTLATEVAEYSEEILRETPYSEKRIYAECEIQTFQAFTDVVMSKVTKTNLLLFPGDSSYYNPVVLRLNKISVVLKGGDDRSNRLVLNVFDQPRSLIPITEAKGLNEVSLSQSVQGLKFSVSCSIIRGHRRSTSQ